MWWRFQSSFVRWLYIKSKWHVAWLIGDQICYCLPSRLLHVFCHFNYVWCLWHYSSQRSVNRHGRGGPWLDILLLWACGGFHWSFSFIRCHFNFSIFISMRLTFQHLWWECLEMLCLQEPLLSRLRGRKGTVLSRSENAVFVNFAGPKAQLRVFLRMKWPNSAKIISL